MSKTVKSYMYLQLTHSENGYKQINRLTLKDTSNSLNPNACKLKEYILKINCASLTRCVFSSQYKTNLQAPNELTVIV